MTISHLLRLCNVQATKSHIRKTLTNHPDYPSLLAVAESLLEWGVETEAVKGMVNELSEADYPAIVHLKSRIYVTDICLSPFSYTNFVTLLRGDPGSGSPRPRGTGYHKTRERHKNEEC